MNGCTFLLRLGTGVILLGTLLAGLPASAASLYQRSLQQFAARTAKADPNHFRFVVVGDSRGGDAVFRKILVKAASHQPLFVLHGGDVGDSGTRKELVHFLGLLAETAPELPVFVVKGNHERDAALFEELIGPRNFTLDCSRTGIRLVAADNSGDALKGPELAYLTRQLAEPRKFKFVALHIPPKTGRWDWHTFSDGAPELLRLLNAAKVDMAFFSHVHTYARDTLGAVPAIVTGGGGGTLYGPDRFPGEPIHHFILVSVDNGKVTAEPVRVEEDKNQ